MPAIRALIVDDEPLARDWVRSQLEADGDIEIVGEAEDGFAAALAIEELSPDAVFLDVQMPGMDGFGVLEALGSEEPPAVVFVTAFDRYAVKAFDANAIDYVMKPFSRKRFRQALGKLKERLERNERGADALEGLRSSLQGTGRYAEWLLVKTGDRGVFVRLRDVDRVEAARNHVVLHCGGKRHAFNATMKSMEKALDPTHFLRIHRSSIVNLDRVKELQPWFNGEYRVILGDGTALTLSAGYKSRLTRFRHLPS